MAFNYSMSNPLYVSLNQVSNFKLGSLSTVIINSHESVIHCVPSQDEVPFLFSIFDLCLRRRSRTYSGSGTNLLSLISS